MLKARDDNVGRAMNGFSVNGRVGAEEQTHGLGVETVVEIVKGLVEVVDARQHLIGQARREGGVQDGRVVENVYGTNLEVFLQFQPGGPQTRPPAHRPSLPTL